RRTVGRGVGVIFGTGQPGGYERRHGGAESGCVHESASGVTLDESGNAARFPVDKKRGRKGAQASLAQAGLAERRPVNLGDNAASRVPFEASNPACRFAVVVIAINPRAATGCDCTG